MRVSQRAIDANRQHRVWGTRGDDSLHGQLQRSRTHSICGDVFSHHWPRREWPKLPANVAVAFALLDAHDHEALGLPGFGERRPFDRARIEDGSREASAREISSQYLMPVDVSRKHGREVGREFRYANHIRGRREGEVARTNGCAFDAMVKTHQANGSVVLAPPGFVEQTREALTCVPSLVRKPR